MGRCHIFMWESTIFSTRLYREWRSPLDPKSSFFSPVRYKPGLNTVNHMVQAAIVSCRRTAEVKESCLLTRHYHPRNGGVLMTRRVRLSSQQIWKTSKYGMKRQNSGCTKGPDARAVYTVVTVSGEYLLRADLKGNKDQTTKTFVSAVQM